MSGLPLLMSLAETSMVNVPARANNGCGLAGY